MKSYGKSVTYNVKWRKRDGEEEWTVKSHKQWRDISDTSRHSNGRKPRNVKNYFHSNESATEISNLILSLGEPAAVRRPSESLYFVRIGDIHDMQNARRTRETVETSFSVFHFDFVITIISLTHFFLLAVWQDLSAKNREISLVVQCCVFSSASIFLSLF